MKRSAQLRRNGWPHSQRRPSVSCAWTGVASSGSRACWNGVRIASSELSEASTAMLLATNGKRPADPVQRTAERWSDEADGRVARLLRGDGPRELHLFLIGGRVVPADGDEGDDHGQAPAVGVGADPGGVFMVAAVFEQLGRFDGLAGVEDVQVADAAAELDDLSAEWP